MRIFKKYSLNVFIKVDKSMLFLSNFMFMELIKLNKFILNIKFINI